MSFHKSTLLEFSAARNALAGILSTAIGRMTEQETENLAQRQSILFQRSAARDFKTMLQAKNSTCVPVGFLDAPQVPRKNISATAEIFIDWASEPGTPRFCIPLPALLEAARSILSKDRSTEQDRKRGTGMVRIVLAYLQMKMFLVKYSAGNPAEEPHLDVVFYVMISDITPVAHKETPTRKNTDVFHPWQGDELPTRPVTDLSA